MDPDPAENKAFRVTIPIKTKLTPLVLRCQFIV